MKKLKHISALRVSSCPQSVPAPPLIGVELNPGPKHGVHLDEKMKWKIVLWAEETKGKTPNYTRIGRKAGCSRHAVRKILDKYKETGSVEDRPGRGRKRIFSDHEAKLIAKKAKRGKFATEIANESGKIASVKTVQRTIIKGGVRYMRLKTRERLTKAHKESRINYSDKMKNFNWNSVMFTDEKCFYLGALPGYTWQDPNNRPEEIKITHPQKLNVWAGAGRHLKTKLYFFTSNMNSQLYCKVLKTCLQRKNITFSEDCPPELPKKWMFLQDNARWHKTDEAMGKLKEMVGDRFIEHPSRSPDLNAMEDLWSYLDRKVKGVRPKLLFP